MRGISLQELSGRLNKKISRQALHKYETGRAKPDDHMIRDIAHALDLKPDYFYREHSVRIEEVSFRKLAKFSRKEQTRIMESARDILERYLELEKIVGKSVAVSNPLKEIEISNKKDVEKAAQQLRDEWALGTDPLFNLLELLEDHGIKILELEVDPSLDGFSTWVNNSVPVIGLNKALAGHLDRYRFNALHELGHLFLNIQSFSVREQEKLCHYFAGAMLLDHRVIAHELGLKRRRVSLQELAALKKQYGISIQAIVYRLNELGIISQATYNSIFKFMSQNNLRKDETRLAKYRGEERAFRFDQLLGQALAEEYITISKAAALKNQSVSQFKREFLIG